MGGIDDKKEPRVGEPDDSSVVENSEECPPIADETAVGSSEDEVDSEEEATGKDPEEADREDICLLCNTMDHQVFMDR